MSGNRVEELEARVRELQATVDGLTDELLETKERLRAIEEAVDPELDMDIIEGQPPSSPETQTNEGGAGGSTGRADGGTDTASADGDKTDQGEDGDTDSADDIIVA
ncbi:MAG: bZIP transcription factor [Haloarculaceae archaeon]